MTSKLSKKVIASCLSTFLLSGAAISQIDEIIVTANKKEQTLQDITMSVTVTSAEQI